MKRTPPITVAVPSFALIMALLATPATPAVADDTWSRILAAAGSDVAVDDQVEGRIRWEQARQAFEDEEHPTALRHYVAVMEHVGRHVEVLYRAAVAAHGAGYDAAAQEYAMEALDAADDTFRNSPDFQELFRVLADARNHLWNPDAIWRTRDGQQIVVTWHNDAGEPGLQIVEIVYDIEEQVSRQTYEQDLRRRNHVRVPNEGNGDGQDEYFRVSFVQSTVRGVNADAAVRALAWRGYILERVSKLIESGLTPLHRAASLGQTEAVKVLIDAGADLEARAERGGDPASSGGLFRPDRGGQGAGQRRGQP